MADTIVLYPALGQGHLVSMVEFGKLILTHYPSFSITIIVSTPPFPAPSSSAYIDGVSAAIPAINFRHLPATPPPPKPFSGEDIPALIYESVVQNNPNLESALSEMSKSAIVKAFVIDFFCSAAMEVSISLNLPTYFYFTTSVNCLATFLYYPILDKTVKSSLKDVKDMLIEIPGLPSVPVAEIPQEMQDRSRKIYHYFVDIGKKLGNAKGIIVNSFDLLEERAVKAIREGKLSPEKSPPPVYCIGPVISGGDSGESECLSWLDSQPSGSVLFLSFGSMGMFSDTQLKEVAIGLENSGMRFLWVVRRKPSGERRTLASPENSLKAIMPEGFLERTRERGFLLEGWAPQMAILSHNSVGGFVSHCGWNSVIESVVTGHPMLAWPLYAEQRLNRVFLVEEMKVALPVNELEDGFVTASELEKRINELMNSDEGRRVRERVAILKEGAVKAWSESGSSRVALSELAESF